MQQQIKDFVVYRNNEIYKQMRLPEDQSREYCAKLNRIYPDDSWSIQSRFYPNETD